MKRHGLRISIALLLLVSLVTRFWKLGTFPGMNGDEAQMGEEVLKFLHHQPFTIRTLSGLYFNPFFLVMEAGLLKVFSATFVMIRLPAAICNLLALLLVYRLHWRAFGDRMQAVLAATMLACLPMALAYSRCAWDTSFMALTAPMVIYPMVMIAQQRARAFDYVLLILGAFLCLWVHVTSGLMLLDCGIAIVVVRSETIAKVVRIRRRGIAASVVLIGLLVVCALLFLLLCAVTYRPPMQTLTDIFGQAIHLVARPGMALAYLGIVGDVLSGGRAYLWFAGQLPTPVLGITSLGMIVLTIFMTVRALRSRARDATVAKPRLDEARQSQAAGDRFLGLIWAMLPILLIVAVGRTGLQMLGSERYVIWLMPMLAILIARTLNRWVIVALCAIFLIQFQIYYFQPLVTGSTQSTLEPKHWTADPPSEVQAEKIIKELDTFPSGRRVFADRWWVEHPMRFVLFGRNEVLSPADPVTQQDLRRGFFVVGFPAMEFINNSTVQLTLAHRRFIRRDVIGCSGKPVLTVIYVPPAEAS